MADGGHYPARLDEIGDDAHRIGVLPQQIGVDLPAWKHKGIEVPNENVLRRQVDIDGIAPIVFVPTLDRALLRRCDGHFGAAF
ncbi:hypothetical protein D3C87_1837630 [compost metagenome]